MYYFPIHQSNNRHATRGEAGGARPPHFLADQKAPPGGGDAPHYYRPPRIFDPCCMPEQGTAIPPFLADGLGWPCPVRSALKRTPVQDFNSFSIIFYCIISTTYQKIGDLFCPVHISGHSHSVAKGHLPKFLLFFR